MGHYHRLTLMEREELSRMLAFTNHGSRPAARSQHTVT